MKNQKDFFSDEDIKHYNDLNLADEFAQVTLEFIFMQKLTAQNINEEIKELMKYRSKEQIYMFWYQIKKNLNKRLKVLINSVPLYGLEKKPDDLMEEFLLDVPAIFSNSECLLDDRFQNIPEKTIRREIEKMIESDRYDQLMMLQDKVMFDCCAMSIGKWMDEHNEKPKFEGNPKGLQYRLAFFNLLMEYQNKMSGGEELVTEVSIKKKGT